MKQRKVTISLNTINKVKEFSDIIQHYTGIFEIAYNDCMIPADSIMSIFSMDLTRYMDLYIESDQTDEFLESIKNFIVEK